jgi:hypothetical protein
MTIHVVYCRFGRRRAHLQVSLCPLVVMSSPSSFHHCICPQSTLRAGARRHGVGVIPLHCHVVPPTGQPGRRGQGKNNTPRAVAHGGVLADKVGQGAAVVLPAPRTMTTMISSHQWAGVGICPTTHGGALADKVEGVAVAPPAPGTMTMMTRSHRHHTVKLSSSGWDRELPREQWLMVVGVVSG